MVSGVFTSFTMRKGFLLGGPVKKTEETKKDEQKKQTAPASMGGIKTEKIQNKVVKKCVTDTEATPEAFATEETAGAEVSQELKEERKREKNQKKMAKDLRKAMQNANDSMLAAQPHVRNSFEGISKFAVDQYIQGIASGLIVPPVSYEDSDQSPVQVSFFGGALCCIQFIL